MELPSSIADTGDEVGNLDVTGVTGLSVGVFVGDLDGDRDGELLKLGALVGDCVGGFVFPALVCTGVGLDVGSVVNSF